MEETHEETPQAEGNTPRPDVISVPVDGVGGYEPVASAVRASDDISFMRWLGELFVLLAVAFVLAFGIKTFVVQPFYIPSGSMEHTLEIGDRVLVNKFVYRFGAPGPGDIVVFESPQASTTDLIKRVIAVEGQTVDVRSGVVYVDGVRRSEPFVNREVPDANADMDEAFKVPAGHVWLMGDNRGNSTDSRVFGPQPTSRILGKAFAIYWPFARVRGL